ncbi:MAG: hypothetical protein KGI07_09775, partial [Thaumarchaeota archaeon]|nr:hypothetical protein [Nitrososphaerota archaeon]
MMAGHDFQVRVTIKKQNFAHTHIGHFKINLGLGPNCLNNKFSKIRSHMISLKPGPVIRKIQDRLYQSKPKNGTGSRDPSWNTISEEQKTGLNAELAMLFPDASENDIKLMLDAFAKYSSVPISQMVFAMNERYAHYKKLTDGQAVNKAWSGFNTIYEMVVLEV